MNKQKRIILLNGKKRSGKNFIGGLLNKYLTNVGLKIKEVSFAYHLKNDVCIMLGITMDELEYHKDLGTEFQIGEKKFSIRTILQKYGTEVRRAENDDIWLERAMPDIFDNDADVIIVTDWRFKSEHAYLTSNAVHENDLRDCDYDVIDVNIQNDNIVSTDTHASENDLNDFVFDNIIKNDTVYDDEDEAYQELKWYFEEFSQYYGLR